MGRPSIYSEELDARVCHLIKGGIDELDAFGVEGVSRRTFFRWQADAKEGVEPFASLWERVEQAASQRNTTLTLYAMRAAKAGNIEAIFKQLKAHRPDLYNDKQRVELSGPNGGPITAGIRYVVHVPEDEPEEQDT
jgi:hypothetical protein